MATDLQGEKDVLSKLRVLPPEVHVFCNLRMLDPKTNKDREIDFLLLHPELGILILETKGGRLEWKGDDWFRIYRGKSEPMKESPGAQLTAQQYMLRQRLQEQGVPLPQITRILALPHMAWPAGAQLDADLPECRVLDQERLKAILPSLRLAVSGGEPWETFKGDPRLRNCRISESTMVSLVAALMPSLIPPPTLEEILKGEGQVQDQAARPILRHLAANFAQGRFHVLGAPGSGKSLISRMVARDLSSQGKKVLVLAFNRALTYASQTEMDDIAGVDVATYHDFITVQLHALGLKPAPTTTAHAYFTKELPALFLEHLDLMLERWDALIIDEAQDLDAAWIPPLLRLLRDPERDPVLLLEDPSQNLCGRGTHAFGTVWHLDLNLRQNPTLRQAVWEAMPDCGWGPPEAVGEPGVMKQRRSSPERWKRDLEEELETLAKEGLEPSQILVLLPNRPERFGLKDGEKFGPWRLNIEKDWWEADHADRIRVNTVHAFKGLEADVVIYLAPSVKANDLPTLRYTALSRARHRAVVLEKALPEIVRAEAVRETIPQAASPKPPFSPVGLPDSQRAALQGALKATREWKG